VRDSSKDPTPAENASVVEACRAAIKVSPSVQPKYLQHRDTGVSEKNVPGLVNTHMALEHAQIVHSEFQLLHGMLTEGTLR
jgi:hypothetical protein